MNYIGDGFVDLKCAYNTANFNITANVDKTLAIGIKDIKIYGKSTFSGNCKCAVFDSGS